MPCLGCPFLIVCPCLSLFVMFCHCLCFHLASGILLFSTFASYVLPNCAFPQLASCPEGTQAASLDIAKAYRNSPIAPIHKCYLPVMWKNSIYVQHVAIEGLVMVGGIQGSIADACIELLKSAGIHPVMKWVDDFIFFRSPQPSTFAEGFHTPSFAYDLSSILDFTAPLPALLHLCQVHLGYSQPNCLHISRKEEPSILKTSSLYA